MAVQLLARLLALMMLITAPPHPLAKCLVLVRFRGDVEHVTEVGGRSLCPNCALYSAFTLQLCEGISESDARLLLGLDGAPFIGRCEAVLRRTEPS